MGDRGVCSMGGGGGHTTAGCWYGCMVGADMHIRHTPTGEVAYSTKLGAMCYRRRRFRYGWYQHHWVY